MHKTPRELQTEITRLQAVIDSLYLLLSVHDDRDKAQALVTTSATQTVINIGKNIRQYRTDTNKRIRADKRS